MAETGGTPPGGSTPGGPPGGGIDIAYAKVLQTSMDSLVATADLFRKTMSGIDLSKIQQAAEGIQEATASWTEDLSKATEFVNTSFRTITATAESFNKLRESGEAFNQFMRIKGQMEKESKEMMEFYKKDLKEVHSLFDVLKTKNREFWDSWKENALGMKALQTAKTADQFGAAAMNPAGALKDMVSMVPGGGFLLWLLWGANKEAGWTAATQQVTQGFDRVKGGAQEFNGVIQQQIKSMEIWNDSAVADLRNVSMAFVAGGIQAKQVWGPDSLGKDLTGIGENLGSVALKFDYLNEQAAGWTASMIAAATKNFGNDVKYAASAITMYGLAAQNAGQDTVGFLNSVMQNAEGLKLYGIQLSDVAAQQLKLIQANRERGLSAQYAGTVGAVGQQQAFQGLQNMDPGYAAYIGAMVLQKLPIGAANALGDFGSSPVGIMMEMRRGFRDLMGKPGGKEAFGATISSIAEQAQQAAGPNRANQEFYLQQMGFGVEGGRAILDMAQSQKEGKAISKEQLAKFKEATESEASKTSSMKQSLNLLVQASADVANGLLGMILMTLKLIVIGLKALGEIIQNPLKGVSEDTAQAMSDVLDGMGRSGNQFMEGLGKLPASLSKFAESGALKEFFFGSWGGMSSNTADAMKLDAQMSEYVAKNMATSGSAMDEKEWKDAIAMYFRERRAGKSYDEARASVKESLEYRDAAGAQEWDKRAGEVEKNANVGLSQYQKDHVELHVGRDDKGLFYVVRSTQSHKIYPAGQNAPRKGGGSARAPKPGQLYQMH